MSGSGPIRATGLGVPAPRRGSGSEPTATAAPASAAAPQQTVRPGTAQPETARPEPSQSLADQHRSEGFASSGRTEFPTEVQAVLLDEPDATGDALNDGELFDLLRKPLPAGAGPGGTTNSRGPSDGSRGLPGDLDAELAAALALPVAALAPPAERRAEGETSTWPGLGIARTNGIWFWLWGPLLAAVVVVSFLAGMASAPVVLPSPGEASPATIVDVRGRALATVEPPTSAEELPAEQLPDLLLGAIVSVQDPGYFSRRGLSASDLFAAGAADVMRVPRHGTTIEERYARQVRVAADSRVPSLRESTVAVRLSQRLTRRALLGRYVNGMYFGNGVYGVAAASRYYFGVPVTVLDPARIAMLAGIADDPFRRNPVTAPAEAVRAQQAALVAMRAAGLLTVDEADVAAREHVDARPHRQLERPSAAPDLTALVESSLLSRFGDDAVYGQNLQVVTPVDLDLQTALGDTVRRLVPTSVPAVLAVASDPRTGDVRALLNRGPASSTSGSNGAGAVLFTRRPLGTLAAGLPVPAGDGRSASLGEVAAAAGAVSAGGIRRDLRAVSSVTRPAAPGRSAEVLDVNDPSPAGQQILPADAALAASTTMRTSARRAGAGSSTLPFAFSVVSGSEAGAHWYVGCVPSLCLTVWTGPSPAGTAGDPSGAQAGLAESVVVQTFRQYIDAAPGRIDLPALPKPRVEVRRPVPPPSVGPTVAAVPTPGPSAVTTPAPAARPSTRPQPSVAPPPPPKPTSSPSPSATAGNGGGGKAGGKGGGGGRGAPLAQGGPAAFVLSGTGA